MEGMIVAIVVAVLGSNGLWNFLSNKFSKKKIKLEKLQAENKKQWECITDLQSMNKALLKDRHMQMCRYLIKKNEISESEAENLETLHNAYVLAGLNGWGERLYEKCMDLPIKKGE